MNREELAAKIEADLNKFPGPKLRGGEWSEVVSALREAGKMREDAERYRWIRTAGAWESEIAMEMLSKNPDEFDAAVDYARAALKEAP